MISSASTAVTYAKCNHFSETHSTFIVNNVTLGAVSAFHKS